MNRVDALTYAFNDTYRPANEREAALAALRSLVTDGSDEAERRQARAAIDSLESNPPEDAPCPLENELLYEYHATALGDVQYVHLHEFLAARKCNANTDKLFFKWLSVSPVARAKTKAMRKHLETYLLASYDAMLARYKAAVDSGDALNEADREALKFYRSWIDSAVMPEAMKPYFREMISALSARCEAPRDNQSR